jgi:coenzyme PQQ precursor peptide PqqA
LKEEATRMTWTKPEFEIVELGMEVGAYAGNA